MLYSFARRLKSTSTTSGIVKSEVPADIGRVVKQASSAVE